MNEERKEKLRSLRGKKSPTVLVTSPEPFVEALELKINQLKDTLGEGIELKNLDDLLEQLGLVQSFQLEVKELKEAIKSITLPDTVEINGLSDLVKATKVLSKRKDPEFNIDPAPFDAISKSIVDLTLKVEEAAVPVQQGQKPEDYIPMRRVMLVGKRLLYDDSHYTGGGGGGSSIDTSTLAKDTTLTNGSQVTGASAPAPTTATWTTATTINTALTSSSTQAYSTATVTTVETGTTTTAGALTFEVYDGTNWWAVSGQQIGSYTVQSSYTLVNNTNVAWTFDIAGFQGFRVRLSTAITGTGSPQVVVITQLQSSPNDNTPTVGVGQQLDSTNDSISAFIKGASYTKLTATGSIVSGACVYYGYTVEVSTSGTLIVYDNTSAAAPTIGGTAAQPLVAGTVNIFPVPIICTTGLFCTIAGTATINFLTRGVSK